MDEFIESLRSGRLTTSKCLLCENLIWPPSHVCPICLSNNIEWVEVNSHGKLLEFSESLMSNKPTIFGVVELNKNIRVLGRIICDNGFELKKGINVKLVRCGIENNDVYYEFQPM